MRPRLKPPLPAFAAAAIVFAAPAVHAAGCDEIRAGIEAKIRAAGVSRFTLSTVPADARAPGKVVGSCELGTKKIVYVVQSPAAAASAPAAASPRDERILTECRDGTISLGGDCAPR